MPKKYRRYQSGGGIAQIKPRSNRSRPPRHWFWGKHGPNPDAPIERLIGGVRGGMQKVRDADRAIDRHIQEQWGFDPEGGASELRKLLELPRDANQRLRNAIQSSVKNAGRHARTLLPGGERPDWRQILIGDLGRSRRPPGTDATTRHIIENKDSWKVGIQNPNKFGDFIASVYLSNNAQFSLGNEYYNGGSYVESFY